MLRNFWICAVSMLEIFEKIVSKPPFQDKTLLAGVHSESVVLIVSFSHRYTCSLNLTCLFEITNAVKTNTGHVEICKKLVFKDVLE